MEHLKPFNEEVEKRKFRSFQKEKQDAIDKKEDEEKRKNYGYNYGYYGRGYDEYDDFYDLPVPPSKSTFSSPSTLPLATGPNNNSGTVMLLTQLERRRGTIESKKISIYEEALMDLYPGIEVRKLPEACIVNDGKIGLYGISLQKDYDLLPTTALKTVCVIDNEGKQVTYGSYWFRKYKKYNVDVYVSPRHMFTMMASNNLTSRDFYKIIGETEETYEITDDMGIRKGLPKLWFNLPYKLGINGGKIISRSEATGGLYDYE